MPSTHFAKQPRTFCRQLLPTATMMTLIRRHGRRMMTTGKLEKTLARVSEIVRMLNLHWQNKKKMRATFCSDSLCVRPGRVFYAMEEGKKYETSVWDWHFSATPENGSSRPSLDCRDFLISTYFKCCVRCVIWVRSWAENVKETTHITHMSGRGSEKVMKILINSSETTQEHIFHVSMLPSVSLTHFLSPLDMTKESSQKSIIWKIYFTGFEILCLVLMCISCCSKLLLYLLAYDEFLASIKSFTTCFHVASVDEQPEHNISSKVEEFTRRKSLPLPQIFLTHSQSESKLVAAANMSTPFRHSHRHRLTSISIPVADFTEPLSNSSHPPARRMSMMPSVSYGVYNPPIRVQTANEMRQARVNRQASTRSQRVAATLANPSSSSTSNLLRSRSLAALHTHPHMRHSPNCKLRRIADDET